MTPEERAEGICAASARAEAAFDKRGWIEMPKADRERYLARALIAKPLIAAAIKDAENEAIGMAAAIAARHKWAEFDHGEWLIASKIYDDICAVRAKERRSLDEEIALAAAGRSTGVVLEIRKLKTEPHP